MLPNRLYAVVALILALPGCGQQSAGDQVKPMPAPERPDNASALIQWMPPNASAGFILGHPDQIAGMADDLVRTFEGVPAMDLAVAGARMAAVGPMRPAARVWGPGLALDRGVAFFESGGTVRVVFGADDLAQALTSLQGVVKAAEGSREIDPKAGTIDELKCALRGPYAVCDVGPIPETAPGPPSTFKDDPIAKTTMAFVLAQGDGPVSGLLGRLPARHVAVTWLDNGASSRLTAKVDLTPPAAVATTIFGGTAPADVMGQVTAGQAFFKLGLAADRVAPLLGGLLAQMPPAVTLVLQELLATWSGDLLLTTDGGLFHPVFVLGLSDATRGTQIVETLAQALVGMCQYPCAEVVPSSRPGLRALRIQSPPNNDRKLSADIHFGVIGKALVLAFSPADLARRKAADYQPAHAGAFADGATHGFRVGNPLMFLGAPWTREVLDLGHFQDISTVTIATGLFYSDLELRVNTADNALAVDLEMRRLPRGGPGRDQFEHAIRQEALGDDIAAQRAWIDLAAAHPDTPFGAAARNQLGGSVVAMVPVMGVLAAVAIPAFTKYVRRSKTSEAVTNVRRMADGATAYFISSSPDGDLAARRFPPSVRLTPGNPTRYMCPGGDSTKYGPTPNTWGHPTWAALGFAVEEPFYYAYEFVSKGTGPDAHFTARAMGDLNCDGVTSTFERIGFVDDAGNVRGGAGVYTNNELE